MKPTIYSVAPIGAGRLAVMAKPVSGEWIDDEFAGIAAAGIMQVVSLLEASEAHEVGLADEKEISERHGLQFLSHPIPDRGLPPSLAEFSRLTRRIHQEIGRGIDTVIHCRAGIGRTGVVAAGILLHAGFEPEGAFERISQARGVRVPDTDEQYEWVMSNHREIVAIN